MIYLVRIDDIGQKVEGLSDQVKGEIKVRQGKGIKGGLQKLKGRINEALADRKLDAADDLDDW